MSTPGTLNYPTSLDDVVSLFEVKNSSTSTLSATLGSGDTTASFTSVSTFPDSGSFSCENEIIYFTGRNVGANQLTGLVRGREGTSAASHASSTAVNGRIVARHHSVLGDAIIAVQTKIGIGSDTPVSGDFLKGTGTGTSAWSALASGEVTTALGFTPANAALSNLASVSINTALIPQSAKDLGATTTPFRDAFLYGSGTFGSHSLRLTGTPTGNRVLTLPDATTDVVGHDTSQTLTNKTLGAGTAVSASVSWADGVKQTFNPDATNAGLNVGSVAGDPSTPANGDLWYDSTANELTARINGASVALGAGGGGSPGGSGSEVQYRGGASTFSAVTGSSVSGGQITLADKLTTTLDNATTNATDLLLDIQHSSSGTPAANFGARLRFGLESSTTLNQDAAAIDAIWTTATHGTRTSKLSFAAVSSGSLAEKMYLAGADNYLYIATHNVGVRGITGNNIRLGVTSGTTVLGGSGVVITGDVDSDTGYLEKSNRHNIIIKNSTITEAGFPFLDVSGTWNAGGVTHDGIKLNATNTASAAGSKLLDLQVGGATLFKVDKVGQRTQSFTSGETTAEGIIEENVTLSTGGATTDSTIDLPANSLILSVTARITTTIAGINSTTLSIGDPTTSARFGSTGTFTAGTTVVGINQWKGNVSTEATGPTQTAAAKVRLTLSGGGDNTPSAGAVRIAIHYMTFTAPTS